MDWRSSRSSCHGLLDEITIITSVIDDSCNCSNFAFFVYPVQKDLVLHNQLPVLIMQQIHTVCLDKRAIWPQFWVIFCKNIKKLSIWKKLFVHAIARVCTILAPVFSTIRMRNRWNSNSHRVFSKTPKKCIFAKSAFHLYPQNLKTAGNLFSAACFL